MTPKDTVLAFLDAMKTNDFTEASKWLSEDFECFWPQSAEVIIGRDNFVAINAYYPANGSWQFDINSTVCEGNSVVTDVSITDGVQVARAITFHTVENARITKQTEFWPDEMPAQEWRANWVKIVGKSART
ncbi:nuclear transport factor 2 family protein [Vibrio parahaemolyticus]|nr:nuclear transport factor 2 family protein [Vibrio parahaemolyticus]MBW6447538.1 nuclear transport factor 2 family protein [Vibrio parahaemolyticus]TPA32892.1 nuclear transport factor 2 family protein [Vibrio parahaemolyticus]HAS3131252.1 nuclear transport factor 2 family protein [Vibrio parahaemolyticus]